MASEPTKLTGTPGAAKASIAVTSQPPLVAADPTADEVAQQAAVQAETTIEADTYSPQEEDDDNKVYDTDYDSHASTSISSSVRDYTFENSRRYHKFKEGRYHFPNDEPEQEREDMKHVMIVSLCNGKLHYAPLNNPRRILDIGTGTGIWAIDMGDEYPEADILGIDLSPIQPAWVPSNVRFMVDDAEATWTHPPNTFDHIHIRHMCSSIRDWPKLISQAYAVLKPGGWIELQELRFVPSCDDDTLRSDNAIVKFINGVRDGLAVFGVNLLTMEKNAELIKEGGFVAIEERVFKVPLGTWPANKKMKMIGQYNQMMIYDGLQGISMGPYTRGLKWTPQDVNVFLIDVRKALMDSSVHTYIPFHITMGQKPSSA